MCLSGKLREGFFVRMLLNRPVRPEVKQVRFEENSLKRQKQMKNCRYIKDFFRLHKESLLAIL